MSRYFVLPLFGALLCAAPALAVEPRQTADMIREGPPIPEDAAKLVAALKEKVEYDGSKIGEKSLFEVLQALAKKHKITFVLMEEEFKAKKVADIKEKKSRVKQLDTKDMIVTDLLDTWLPGVGATYKIHEEYVAVWPLPTKVQEPAPVLNLRKADAKPTIPATEAILSILTEVEANFGDVNVNEVPLFELLQNAAKRYNLTFVINETAFKVTGQPNIKEEKPTVAATSLRGLKLHQCLSIIFDSMGATYLVKGNVIEIVPIAHAAKVTKAGLAQDDDGPPRLKETLVSAIIKEKPLNEAVAKIAEMYDLNVVVSPQSGDARTGFVTARLLNMPADKAIELLALQCDLRVVRRGAAFLITSRDHANELFEEGLEKERKKIEIQKLREAPAKPPEKAPAPEPVPPPKPAEK